MCYNHYTVKNTTAGVVNHPPANRESVQARQALRNAHKVELALPAHIWAGGTGESQ